ncbi:alpha/beta hydrolase family protein [Dictyobacter aurantiacus]|uniref:Alpha/beta hydrolase n=1 Tax=Dictyobacter aurantiacus TaxID=1936993 RepID=A0A401Z794_9CHLR|nr:hypothetical protein [Dictyobacter aurantiacus]GCE02723.1 hypothetical protein KDAU_00520 [Dictyobacter aurantiacus]
MSRQPTQGSSKNHPFRKQGRLVTEQPLKKKHKVARILLGMLFIGSICASVFPWGRSIIRSLVILPALISATQPGVLINNGDTIKHTQMSISSQSGPVYLDIFMPVGGDPLIKSARGGVLIVPGVGDNRQIPQLLNLSEAFARTGLIVMDMTTPTLMAYNISVQDTDATVQAFKKLESLPGMAGRRSGMIAFSGGVPLTCFAAADPRIRNEVAYIAAFGGYFDTTTLLEALGSRSITIDGKTEAWHPIDIPIQVLTNMTTQDFSYDEQTTLRAGLASDAQPLTGTQLQALSPGAQAMYHLLKGDEPQQVTRNIKLLPPDIQKLLTDLSPKRVIKDIRAPIFLLHDRNDNSLPVTETREFDAELTQLRHKHEYVEFHIFDHVEVRSGLNVGQLAGDGFHLFSILDNLLYTGS